MTKFTKQFQVVLYDEEVLVTSPLNFHTAFVGKLNPVKPIKIGWHESIETSEQELNYYEVCGILILFKVELPSYEELIETLQITPKEV